MPIIPIPIAAGGIVTVNVTGLHVGEITIESGSISQTVAYDELRWEALTYHLLGVLSLAPSDFTVRNGAGRIFGGWDLVQGGTLWTSAIFALRAAVRPTADEFGFIYVALGP